MVPIDGRLVLRQFLTIPRGGWGFVQSSLSFAPLPLAYRSTMNGCGHFPFPLRLVSEMLEPAALLLGLFFLPLCEHLLSRSTCDVAIRFADSSRSNLCAVRQ